MQRSTTIEWACLRLPTMAPLGQFFAQTVQPVHRSVSMSKTRRPWQAPAGQTVIHDVRFVLVAEEAQRAEHGVGRRLAETAERRLLDGLGEFLEVQDAAESLETPLSSPPGAR